MSFALACVQLLVFLICLARNEMASKFHDGFWCIKFLLVAGLLIGSLWITNDFFIDYLHFSQWVSFFFLCFQAMLMLIVAYTINDTLVRNVDVDGGKMGCSAIILISLTLILFGGNITWIVFQYIEFSNSFCGWNWWQMTITCVAAVAMYGLVLLRTRKDASIFTSSLVLTYVLYLQWSALSSNPNLECNPYVSAAWNTTFLMIMGMVFTFISLLIISAATFKEEKTYEANDNAQAAVNVATGLNAPFMEKENAEDVKLAQQNI